MKTLGLLSTLILMLGLAACAKKAEPQIDRITEAYRLIDAQRDDEAIALLEKVLQDEPNNREAKVTLASAYAHKAGFKIQAFWGMVDSARRKEIATLKLEGNPNSAPAKFIMYLRATLTFARAMENLPELDAKKYSYLEYGLGILDGIDPKEKKPSDHILSALYRLVIFKARVGWMYTASSFTAKDDKGQCNLIVERLADGVLDSARLLEKITFDLSYAFPKEQIELQNSRKRLASFTQNLALQLDTLGVIDDAFKITFKNGMMQRGLGELVQCSGDATTYEM